MARRLTSPAPLVVAGRGLLAGLGASLLLSCLARVLPGMENTPEPPSPADKPSPPEDPFDARAVEQWQALSQAPAARAASEAQDVLHSGSTAAVATPAGALAQPTAPGPEGLAEQFAFKIASGVFGIDLAPHARAAGIGAHLLYGSSWGVLYGLVQGTVRQPPTLTGTLFGLFVWLIGPALLVPAMRLMRAPQLEPPVRTAMLIVGHVAYGLTVAGVYETLER